jgi:hypothetical protein
MAHNENQAIESWCRGLNLRVGPWLSKILVLSKSNLIDGLHPGLFSSHCSYDWSVQRTAECAEFTEARGVGFFLYPIQNVGRADMPKRDGSFSNYD